MLPAARWTSRPVWSPRSGGVLAKAVGVMCGLTAGTDVVDGHVALHARRRGLGVVTSDPDDISAFDSALTVIAI